jgi:hypothetical protein
MSRALRRSCAVTRACRAASMIREQAGELFAGVGVTPARVGCQNSVRALGNWQFAGRTPIFGTPHGCVAQEDHRPLPFRQRHEPVGEVRAQDPWGA